MTIKFLFVLFLAVGCSTESKQDLRSDPNTPSESSFSLKETAPLNFFKIRDANFFYYDFFGQNEYWGLDNKNKWRPAFFKDGILDSIADNADLKKIDTVLTSFLNNASPRKSKTDFYNWGGQFENWYITKFGWVYAVTANSDPQLTIIYKYNKEKAGKLVLKDENIVLKIRDESLALDQDLITTPFGLWSQLL